MSNTTKFGIEINFLTGRYVATFYNNRQQSEWPPHPARVFSALVASWAEDGCDSNERKALKWLETLGPPAITASCAVPRKVVSHFVPINDTSIVDKRFYKNRFKSVLQLKNELVNSDTKNPGEVKRIRKNLEKALEVDKQVSHLGRTKSSDAMALIMLPHEESISGSKKNKRIDGRPKRERFFPSIRPENPRVTYSWENVPSTKVSKVLDNLLGRVTRLGHSSSLVSCRLILDPPKPTLVPKDNGKNKLRCFRAGQLTELEKRYKQHLGSKPRMLPFDYVHYHDIGEISTKRNHYVPNTVGKWLIFEFDHSSRSFPATRVVELAKSMRSAILHYIEDPIPEGLSGHQSGGQPSVLPHIAFLPIPFAGFMHADGRILGIAISIPKVLDLDVQHVLYRAIGKWEEEVKAEGMCLTLGSKGVIRMSRLLGPATLTSLRPNVWKYESKRWVSVTPIALPKHPGRLTRGTAVARAKAWAMAKRAVISACAHVGLPEPSCVYISLDPFIAGTFPATRFPEFKQPRKDGLLVRRQLVHASLTYDRVVTGPLMLGTGRFFGLGLMRPIYSKNTKN